MVVFKFFVIKDGRRILTNRIIQKFVGNLMNRRDMLSVGVEK